MIVVVWLLFAVAGYYLGEQKGERWKGFFLGLLLGPLGLLIIYLSKGDRRQCHACKSLIAIDATVCPHCRTAQRWGEVQ